MGQCACVCVCVCVCVSPKFVLNFFSEVVEVSSLRVFTYPQVRGDGLSTGVGLGRRLEGYVVALAKKLASAGPLRRLSEFSLKKVEKT